MARWMWRVEKGSPGVSRSPTAHRISSTHLRTSSLLCISSARAISACAESRSRNDATSTASSMRSLGFEAPWTIRLRRSYRCSATRASAALSSAVRPRTNARRSEMAARRAASGDVRVSGLHAVLREDQGRAVHREAEDAGQADGPQAEKAAGGSPSADACGGPPSTPLDLQRSAGARRVLRRAVQLPGAQQLPPPGAAHLVPQPQAAQPASPHMGELQ